MRVQLFEFEDLSWFPDIIRTGGTDFLRYFLITSELYKPIIPLINQTLKEINETKIIDLCSGGGGYIEQVHDEINKISGHKISITLTDKFPNINAYDFLRKKTNDGINYISASTDATNVPKDLNGFRTMFSAVHHFQPEQIKSVLKNAIENRAAIGFFDGGEKSIFAILGLIIIHPIAFFIFTPFFKPFKISRLFFTYIIPLIPIYTVWDGVVSILRMYNPTELRQLAESLGTENNYIWTSGKTKNRFGIRATYLIGYPKNK
ncbi:hypothetical protein [Fluviicola sp.]|uniref:hypothetical protein n=1 Tax=Fluviicola sp. TaxID=1917219 RepID=UPI003D2D07BF